MTYTLATSLPLPWAEAVERTREALAAQGFGILTEIDVRATFGKKLGAEAADAVGDYVILGACNPALASQPRAGGGAGNGRPVALQCGGTPEWFGGFNHRGGH